MSAPSDIQDRSRLLEDRAHLGGGESRCVRAAAASEEGLALHQSRLGRPCELNAPEDHCYHQNQPKLQPVGAGGGGLHLAPVSGPSVR
jgi:hypothetical protein